MVKELWAACLAGCIAFTAAAAEPEAVLGAETTTTATVAARPGPRPIPSYDGRPPADPTLGAQLLWVPRVLFYPVYLSTEYLLRQPLGWLLTAAEKGNWVDTIIGFFTFDERRLGIVPILYVDLNFKPSAGFYIFWNQAPFTANQIRTSLSYSGSDWMNFALTDRIELDEGGEFSAGFHYAKRPDYLFFGLGPDSRRSDLSRYLRRSVGGELSWSRPLWRSSAVRLMASIYDNRFEIDDSTYLGENHTLGESIRAGAFPAPPGLDGYLALTQSAEATLDTREPRPAEGTGLRLHARLSHSTELKHLPHAEWLQVALAASGYLDLSANRVLGLSVYGAHTAGFGGPHPIPFTELHQSGTHPLLLGSFEPGRLIGESLFVASLEYRYPIWVYLDGALYYSVGNVFGPGFEGLEAEALRQSFGLGLRSVGDRDTSFNLLLAFGTKTFREGGGIENLRFVLGAQTDF